MMTMQRIVNYVSAEPFRPFRIKMNSGDTFDIRHPEMVAVGRTTAHVFTWMSEDNEDPQGTRAGNFDPVDRVHRAIEDISATELIAAPSQSSRELESQNHDLRRNL